MPCLSEHGLLAFCTAPHPCPGPAWVGHSPQLVLAVTSCTRHPSVQGHSGWGPACFSDTPFPTHIAEGRLRHQVGTFLLQDAVGGSGVHGTEPRLPGSVEGAGTVLRAVTKFGWGWGQGSWENRAGATSHQTRGWGDRPSRARSGEWSGGHVDVVGREESGRPCRESFMAICRGQGEGHGQIQMLG